MEIKALSWRCLQAWAKVDFGPAFPTKQRERQACFQRFRQQAGFEWQYCFLDGQPVLLLAEELWGQTGRRRLTVMGCHWEEILARNFVSDYFEAQPDLYAFSFNSDVTEATGTDPARFLDSPIYYRPENSRRFETIYQSDLFALYMRTDAKRECLEASSFLRIGEAVPAEARQLLRYLNMMDSRQNYLPQALVDQREQPPLICQALQELEAYTKGQRQAFSIPLKLPEGQTFSERCWRELSYLPFGALLTYEELAERALGREDGGRARDYARAAGMACSRNPLPVFVPCHRVLGRKGELTGFAGGLDLKERLLNFELLHYKKS